MIWILELKMFDRYGTFNQITNRSMEYPSHAYLHCDLLNRAALTTITLIVKSLHINMHEWYLQKGMFVRVKNFGIELKSKRDFEKDDMHVVITIELTTIVSPIIVFEPKLFYMFFHMDSIRKVKSSFQNWNYLL